MAYEGFCDCLRNVITLIGKIFPMAGLLIGTTPVLAAMPMQPIRLAVVTLEGVGWRQMGIEFNDGGLAELKRLGFNSLWVSAGTYKWSPKDWWNDPEKRILWAEKSALAKKHGLDAYLVLHVGWNAADLYRGIRASRNVTEEGKVSGNYSIVDPRFWEDYLNPIGDLFAQCVAHAGASGILFELELYAGGTYDREQPDYSDYAIEEFFKARGEPLAELPPPEERPDLIKRKGLRDDLMAWEKEQLIKLVTAFRQRIRAIAPLAKLGFYLSVTSVNNWFFEAMSKGLYEPGHPIINLDPNTYYGVGIDWLHGGTRYPLWTWADRQRAIFRQWNVEALIALGIYFDASYANFSPKEVARFCFISGLVSDGYWIWNERTPPEPYWNAVQSAFRIGEWVRTRPEDFLRYVENFVALRKSEGFDTAHSEGLLEQARKSTEPMRSVWAYQALWNLEK